MPAPTPLDCLSAPAASPAFDAPLPVLVRDAIRRAPLPAGLRFVFSPSAAMLRRVHDVVEHERAACASLDFRVGVSPGGGFLTLDVTGPEGTAARLEAAFGPLPLAA